MSLRAPPCSFLESRNDVSYYGEFPVIKLSSTEISPREEFSEYMARLLLITSTSRGRSRKRGLARFLSDRIHFTVDALRPNLLYREIHGIHQHPERPELFTLCVFDEQSGQKYYECFQSSCSDDVVCMRQLLKRSATNLLGSIGWERQSITSLSSDTSSVISISTDSDSMFVVEEMLDDTKYRSSSRLSFTSSPYRPLSPPDKSYVTQVRTANENGTTRIERGGFYMYAHSDRPKRENYAYKYLL